MPNKCEITKIKTCNLISIYVVQGIALKTQDSLKTFRPW